MKHFFHFLFVALALCVGVSLSAGNVVDRDPVESNLQLGVGTFAASSLDDFIFGWSPCIRISYGLDCALGDRWSIIPGLAVQTSVPWPSPQGEVFCQGRYWMPIGKSAIVFGLGPEVSYRFVGEKHDVSDPNDPDAGYLYQKEIFNRFTTGLLPSISFLCGRYWLFGIEAEVGVTSAIKQYKEQGPSSIVRIHQLRLTCGFRF